MTNAEKIRKMTDEELAEYLPSCRQNGDCFGCPILADYSDATCYECALRWLKSEVEEDVADIKAALTVEAELVRHGHWEESCNELNKYCSECKEVCGTIYEHENYCPNCGAKMAKIEAEPVKHGHWIDVADKIYAKFGEHTYVCSVCKKEATSFVGGSENWWCSDKPNFCPNCGTKMDKEERE